MAASHANKHVKMQSLLDATIDHILIKTLSVHVLYVHVSAVYCTSGIRGNLWRRRHKKTEMRPLGKKTAYNGCFLPIYEENSRE